MQLISKFQNRLFKVTVIIVLFFGGLSPAFREDKTAQYVGIFSVTLLTVLSLMYVLGQNKEST
jgi:hypothetical protein